MDNFCQLKILTQAPSCSNSYPSFKEPCHGKSCLQVTIMWHVLLVSGQPQTHSAWLPVRYGRDFQMVRTWHYIALTFAISLVSSYINQNSSMLNYRLQNCY